MNNIISIPIDQRAPQRPGMTASVRLADGRRTRAFGIDVGDAHAHFVPVGFGSPTANARST